MMRSQLILTVVVGDVVRNVHLSVTVLQPHAATAGAGVGVLLCFIADSDVPFNQFGHVVGAH